MEEFLTFNTRDLDLHIGSGNMAHRRASLIDPYLYVPNFNEIGRKKIRKSHFLPSSKSRDKKPEEISKIRPEQI